MDMGPVASDHRQDKRAKKLPRAHRADDPVWLAIREEVNREVDRESILASFLYATILKHDTLEDALSFHLAGKLGGQKQRDQKPNRERLSAEPLHGGIVGRPTASVNPERFAL